MLILYLCLSFTKKANCTTDSVTIVSLSDSEPSRVVQSFSYLYRNQCFLHLFECQMLCFLLCPYLQVPQGTESAGWFPLTKLFKGSSICRKFRDPRNNYYLYITSCPGLPGVNHGDSDAVIPCAPIRLGRESSSSAAHQYWNIRVEQFSMLTCKIFRDFMPDILVYIVVIVQQHHTDVKQKQTNVSFWLPWAFLHQ